jgi:hypothetical protein
MKRTFLPAVLGALALALVLPAPPIRAADAAREARRMRLVALETLLQEKKAAIEQGWARLAEVESLLQEAAAEDVRTLQSTEARSAEQASALLKGAERRKGLEEERLALLRRLADHYGEASALRREADKVRSELQGDLQVLDGRWILSLLPSGVKGEVTLSQNGTLVTGDYHLDNGQSGSLQGTFVNNVLVLERIDARFGRMGRLEGTLSRDRLSVKGSWYSYDIASGQPVTGAFAMERPAEEEGP